MNAKNQIIGKRNGHRQTRRKLEHRHYSQAKRTRMKITHERSLRSKTAKIKGPVVSVAERRRIRAEKKQAKRAAHARMILW